jgi:hypothetical protein
MSLMTPALEVHPARSKAGQVNLSPQISCHPEVYVPNRTHDTANIIITT